MKTISELGSSTWINKIGRNFFFLKEITSEKKNMYELWSFENPRSREKEKQLASKTSQLVFIFQLLTNFLTPYIFHCCQT